MPIPLALTARVKVLIAAIVGMLLVVPALWMLFFRHEPTPGEQRLAHLHSIVTALEAYAKQNGVYPEPTSRMETIGGIQHVWGYRPDVPSLASCTMLFGKDQTSDPLHSGCGGGIYDAHGTVIGWKGTLTPESALNSIEVATKGTGRLASPFSEIMRSVPLDPLFALRPDLRTAGFGEYVYAVRIPEDGAKGKGGVQYQIAATVPDPATKTLRTFIKGNYFVRSDEQDTMPSSLIGPGILLDEHGNPLEPGARPLEVLLDGQQRGFPNPLIGEGETILRRLALAQRTETLLRAVDARARIAASLLSSEALSHLQSAIDGMRAELAPIATALSATGNPQVDATGSPSDLSPLETQVTGIAAELEQALQTFTHEKAGEVGEILRAESDHRDAMTRILSGALLHAANAEKFVLLARDEVLRYLNGEGIEDQSRSRAGRKIESALAEIPDLAALFKDAQLPLPDPFLPENAAQVMQELSKKGGAVRLHSGSGASATGITVSMFQTVSPSSSSSVTVSTVVAELRVLFMELRGLLTEIANDLRNPTVTAEGVDEKLRHLARALGSENERISALFGEIADIGTAAAFLTEYESLRSAGRDIEAIRAAAANASQEGDFGPFLFSPASLENIILERKAGIPDVSAHTHESEAEYQGIPYPLP